MAKSKVTLDIMHGKDRTVKVLLMEHVDTKISQVVVIYLNDDFVSPCKGIMSCLFLHARASCHVFLFCSLVCRSTMRGGHTAVGARHARACEVEDFDPNPVDQITWSQVVRVPSRPFWTEDKFVVTSSSGIRNREKSVIAEFVARELERTKPGKWDACRLESFGQRRRRLTCVLGTIGC